jgi:hypothetical protein
MGGSQSTVTQVVNTNIINQSTLNAFNEQVNKNIANIVMKSAQTSGGNITQLDTTNFGIIAASGHADVTVDNDSTQNAKLSFKAIQQSLQTINLKESIADAIAEQMKSSMNNNTFNSLISQASSNMQKGFLSLPGGSSSSNVNTEQNTNISTNQTTNLKNIVKSLIETNASTNAIKNCFANVLQNQTTNFAGIYASQYATVDITNKTNQIAQTFATCQQMTQQTNNITTKLASIMGIKVQQSTTDTVKNKSTATAKSTLIKKGLGDFIDGIINTLGNFFKGTLGMIILGVILIACLGLSGYSVYAKMKSSNKNKQSSSTTTPTQTNKDDDSGDGDGSGDDGDGSGNDGDGDG